MDQPLTASFYDRPVLDVARDLLGKRLVRKLGSHILAGLISETEAYRGEEDLACHARAGRTPRTIVMYGPPGIAYVYFTYGMHWCLNCVTGPEDFPAAVLLRALEPRDGLDEIAKRRPGRSPAEWCSGPARLCQALSIDKDLNGKPLTTQQSGLWIEEGIPVEDNWVSTGPRVGINQVPEPWRSIPWRFRVSFPRSTDST